MEGLGVNGCEAVVLGCAGIFLLVLPSDSLLPVLDSTRILARTALAKSKTCLTPDNNMSHGDNLPI